MTALLTCSRIWLVLLRGEGFMLGLSFPSRNIGDCFQPVATLNGYYQENLLQFNCTLLEVASLKQTLIHHHRACSR
ncbi:hypothetical protein KC19_6G130300 [Ceratodon purpureus]|uniref:Secreted protein n=1 Tax=Ceratodon purpureus TaxID=3225 RepID=A0A8T0HG82_CERPU|nr:hypothetical protein KC19_6G130300 [Ceratodon purpureus]